MNKNFLGEAIGWCSIGLILAGYGLISFNFLPVSSIFYQILNFIGAIGVAYISFKKNAEQPAVLNVIWAIIALTAIVRAVI